MERGLNHTMVLTHSCFIDYIIWCGMGFFFLMLFLLVCETIFYSEEPICTFTIDLSTGSMEVNYVLYMLCRDFLNFGF